MTPISRPTLTPRVQYNALLVWLRPMAAQCDSARSGAVVVQVVVRLRRNLRVFFFFQAEDGIRDYKVTGVQTCALLPARRGRLPRGAVHHRYPSGAPGESGPRT